MGRLLRNQWLNLNIKLKFTVSAEEKALRWKIKFDKGKNVYQLLVGPVWDLLRLVGRAPFYRKSDGTMEIRYFSAIMLYTLMCYSAVLITTVLSIIDVVNFPSINFSIKVEKMLLSGMLISQIIIPILCWLQLRNVQSYWHLWSKFQERFEEVTDSKFPSVSEVRPSYSHLCFHTFMTFFVMFILEPHCVSNLLRWYYIPGLFFTKIGNVAHFWFWILTSRMVVKVSKEFHKHFHMILSKTKRYSLKIEEYRLLWIHLSCIVRESGSSGSLFISVFLINLILNFVFSFYLCVFRIPENLSKNQYMNLFSQIVVTYVWWAILEAYCDAGYQMTKNCLNPIQEEVLRIKTRINSIEEGILLNIFFFTLRIFPPVATVSEFYVVNRALFGTIMTLMVTYIIVLIQFHVNQDL